MIRCTNCGVDNPDRQVLCRSCSQVLGPVPSIPIPKPYDAVDEPPPPAALKYQLPPYPQAQDLQAQYPYPTPQQTPNAVVPQSGYAAQPAYVAPQYAAPANAQQNTQLAAGKQRRRKQTSSTPPTQLAIPTSQAMPAQAPNREYKSPSTGFLLELLGFVGFLGIGHMWAGKVLRGVMLMFGYWAFMVVLPFFFLFSGSLGNVLVLLCVWALLVILIPIGSGAMLRGELKREQGIV